MAQEPILHRASNTDPNPGPVGEKPYEMAGRKEPRTPLFHFDGDITGWVVEGHNAEGRLVRSEERKLFRERCAKLVYVARGENPWLLVRPEEPIDVPDPWDALSFWNWGNNWGWAPDPKTPQLRVSAVLRDAAGWQFELSLGAINYQYWFPMNARLHGEHLARIKRPVSLVGIKLTNAGNKEERTIYLGPCYAFREEWNPLEFEPWPDSLPFPTRRETILPTHKTKTFTNSVRENGAATEFVYAGHDCELTYRVTPATGTLGDIELVFNGRRVKPCAGGGVQLATSEGLVPPMDERVRRRLVGRSASEDTLTVEWDLGAGDATTRVTYRYRLLQKSLVVEMAADRPVVERVALGRTQPVTDPKLIRIPYLTYGHGDVDPRCLYADGLFLFCQFDWYYGDGSTLRGANAAGPDWAQHNESCRYVPKTNGERNLLKERLFLTASPDFQEVLPTIPNPASPMKQAMGDRLWRVRSGADHAAEIAEATRYRKYGVEKVAIRYHENTWRDAGESYTFRVDAAPKRGGDDGLRRFVKAVQDLGWRVGLYTNYTDYAPVNSYWNEDWVARHPNGDWMRAWMRCYAPKPMRAVEMEAKLAPQIQAKFGENHSYCDVHTAVTPFSRVDYDHRVPGAGTYRRTFECFGRLLHNEKSAHKGPVYSEGLFHWFYAGLTDGNYAQLTWPSPPHAPLLVDFDLLKMHPLQMDAGMGAPGMFFRGTPPDLDQFIATTLAYGHIGFFDWRNLAGALRIYYMLQPIQAHYTMVPVARIAYEHAGGMVDTSEAIKTGAYLNGRVHVVYENGTQVWVNGSPEAWTIEAPRRPHLPVLPRWGHLAVSGDGSTKSTSRVQGATGEEPGGPRRRVDLCTSPTQHYMCSRDGYAWADKLATEGAAALKQEGDAWWVIPADACADFGFDPQLIGDGPEWTVTGHAEDGSTTEPPTIRWSRGLLHVIPGGEGALKYKLESRDAAPPPTPSAGKLAALGGTVSVRMPPGYALRGQAVWEIGRERLPAGADADDGGLRVAVPAAAKDGDHVWLEMPVVPAGVLHLDFIAVEPVTVSIEADLPQRLGEGEELSVAARMSNQVAERVEVAVSCRVEGGKCTPSQTTMALEARGQASRAVGVGLPRKPGTFELSVGADAAGRNVVAKRRLVTEWELPVVLDLMDPDLRVVRGFCARGETETVGIPEIYFGEFELTRARSGGEERACIFTHPPYATGRVGYVFGRYEVALPQEFGAQLEFAMGMRDGLDATDGVTFKVVVEADGGRTEVWSRHHAELRWAGVTVDLAAYTGKTVTLILVADCGPADNTTADHALWADPRVVIRDERAKKLLVREAE